MTYPNVTYLAEGENFEHGSASAIFGLPFQKDKPIALLSWATADHGIKFFHWD